MQKQNLTDIESRLVNQLKAIKFLQRKLCRIPSTFEERIYIYYLEYCGVSNTTKVINDEGYRMTSRTGGRVYVTTDITKIIKDNASNNSIDPAIRYIVNEMLRRKNGYIKFMTLLIQVTLEAIERFDNNG